MDIKGLLGLRPKAETLEEVAAAIERTGVAIDQGRAEVARLLARRGETLVAGDGAAVQAAEERLAAARAEVERAEAMMPVLQAKAECLRREAEVARVRELQASAQAKLDAFARWYREQYPRHAAEIVRGFHLAAEVNRTNAELMEIARKFDVPLDRMPASALAVALPGASPAYSSPGDLAHLPPLEWAQGGEPRLAWPPAGSALDPHQILSQAAA